jgi:hypothetical protein
MKTTTTMGSVLMLGALAFASGAFVSDDAQAHPCTHWECGYVDFHVSTFSRACGQTFAPRYQVDVYDRYVNVCGTMPGPGNCACYGESCTNYCTSDPGCYQYSYEVYDDSICWAP